MKLHDTRSGELISGSVTSGVTADELDHALQPAVEKLLAPLRPEALQEKISDQRQAAKQALEKDERRSRYKTIVLSAFATLGYASTSTSSSLPASSGSASGFSYDLGGQLFVHLAGPLYAGGFVDFAFFPAVGGGTANGLLAGGGVRFDLGDNTALLAGAGYSDLSKNGGSGYGFLGALEYGIFRLQLAWRHGTSSVVSGLSAVDQTTNVIAVQAGVSISF